MTDTNIKYTSHVDWAVNLPLKDYTKYGPLFGQPVSPTEAMVEKHFTCSPSSDINLTMLLLVDDDKPLGAYAEFSLHDNKKNITLTATKQDSAIDDHLSIEYKNILYTAWFTKPEEVTVYVHQRPVDVAFECPSCGRDVNINYDDFCAEHGDPPDWRFDTITCPNCGQKITIENQDWDC